MWPLNLRICGGWGLGVGLEGGGLGSGQNIPPLLIADPLVCLGYQRGSKAEDDKFEWERGEEKTPQFNS